MASIIPPKKPRKPGMPKLEIPSRPSTSPAAGSSHFLNPTLGQQKQEFQPAQRQPPALSTNAEISHSHHLSPQRSTSAAASTSAASYSSLSLSIPTYQDEAGYDDGNLGFPSTASTIYPDTVPYLTNVHTQNALTDDLRRAIGGLSLDTNHHHGGLPPPSSSSTITSSSSHLNDPLRVPRTSSDSLRLPAVGGRSSSSGYAAASSTSESLLPLGSSKQGDDVVNASKPLCSEACRSSSSSSSSPSSSSHQTQRRPSASSSASVSGGANDETDDLVLQGNLELLQRLGEGASGEVRKARHKPTGLLMAKKTISTSPNPSIHRQILRELSFNRTCHSDYIVRYYGAFLEDEDTSIAICMEYCEAGSLDAIYKKVKSRNGRTGEKVLGKIGECVLKGLGYLHERKIIHRDIKPSNILVTRQGQIKLCDFGVSGELINSVAGTFTGTSYYMAPERIKGLPYSITSDVWSLGLTILEVASNRFPFPPEGDPPLGPIDLLSYVVNMKVPELQDDERAGIKWGKALRDFIERCLEKEPSKRPGPNKMMSHPFIRKSETRQPQPDIAKFVADVWGWSSTACDHGEKGDALRQVCIGSGMEGGGGGGSSMGLGRLPSLRQAPKPVGIKVEAMSGVSSTTASIHRLTKTTDTPSASPSRGDTTATPLAQQQTSVAEDEKRVSKERTEEERVAAKMREADIGLVGSPTEG